MRRIAAFCLPCILLAAGAGIAGAPKEIASFQLGMSIGMVAFSPNGKMLAAASLPLSDDPNVIVLWDVATKKQSAARLQAPNFIWASMAFSPDSKTLSAVSLVDRNVYLWDVATGKETARLAHSEFLYCVTWSPDGKSLATTDRSGTVTLWDRSPGQPSVPLQGSPEFAQVAVFSPDGKRIASGTRDSLVQIWDLKAKQVRSTLQGHRRTVRTLAFSPDGKLLASAGKDTTIRVWDLARERTQATLKGHTHLVGSLDFSPDGRYLASTGYMDKTARLWDLKTGKEIAVLRSNGPMTDVAFFPDGKVLATACQDGTVKLWDVAPLFRSGQ